MIAEPKKLLTTATITPFGEMCSSPDFQRYAYTALAQLVWSLRDVKTMEESAMNYARLEGARMLIATLCSLHELPAQIKPAVQAGVLR